MRRLVACLLAASLGVSAPAYAVVISYQVEQVLGPQWRYDYTVQNDAQGLGEFTIWFDRNLFSDVSIESSPGGWDSIAIDPDPSIPADGFFDSLALGAGIALGESLGGFSVLTTFLGSGSPAAQTFDAFDADFNLILTGVTTIAAAPPSSVPEPGTLELVLAGLMIAFARRRRAMLIES